MKYDELAQQSIGFAIESTLPGDSILWHYTSRAGLLGIVSTKQLWATDARYLNDASEIVHAIDAFDQYVKSLSARKELTARLAPAVAATAKAILEGSRSYIFSLSSEKDDLSQWRAYTGPSTGYAIGFDRDKLQRYARSVQIDFAKCIYGYEQKLEKFRRLLDMIAKVNDLDSRVETAVVESWARATLTIAQLMKDSSFQAEREWRLVVRGQKGEWFRDTGRLLAPYAPLGPVMKLSDFGIIEVCVGPSAHAELEAFAVNRLLIACGAPEVRVSSSSIPYRHW